VRREEESCRNKKKKGGGDEAEAKNEGLIHYNEGAAKDMQAAGSG